MKVDLLKFVLGYELFVASCMQMQATSGRFDLLPPEEICMEFEKDATQQMSVKDITQIIEKYADKIAASVNDDLKKDKCLLHSIKRNEKPPLERSLDKLLTQYTSNDELEIQGNVITAASLRNELKQLRWPLTAEFQLLYKARTNFEDEKREQQKEVDDAAALQESITAMLAKKVEPTTNARIELEKERTELESQREQMETIEYEKKLAEHGRKDAKLKKTEKKLADLQQAEVSAEQSREVLQKKLDTFDKVEETKLKSQEKSLTKQCKKYQRNHGTQFLTNARYYFSYILMKDGD